MKTRKFWNTIRKSELVRYDIRHVKWDELNAAGRAVVKKLRRKINRHLTEGAMGNNVLFDNTGNCTVKEWAAAMMEFDQSVAEISMIIDGKRVSMVSLIAVVEPL